MCWKIPNNTARDTVTCVDVGREEVVLWVPHMARKSLILGAEQEMVRVNLQKPWVCL